MRLSVQLSPSLTYHCCRFCDWDLSGAQFVYSTGNKINLAFHSDGNINSTGFIANCFAIEPSNMTSPGKQKLDSINNRVKFKFLCQNIQACDRHVVEKQKHPSHHQHSET